MATMSAIKASRYFMTSSLLTVYSTDKDTKKHKRRGSDICAFCAFSWLNKLHTDRAARDTCSRIARRISLHIVRFLVNDQRSPAIREKAIGSIAQHDMCVSYSLL